MFDSEIHPHRRYNPLTGASVLVSPQRLNRPWRGQQETEERTQQPVFDAGCYLCPGNLRSNGIVNPQYKEPFVFANDFPSLLTQPVPFEANASPFFQSSIVQGANRVICYSPRHDLTLAEMPLLQVMSVVDAWCNQVAELHQHFPWVQIFENKGEMMGCSNPHPHGQIWATTFLPTIPSLEDFHMRSYREKQSGNLLVDYAAQELIAGERIVAANDEWLCVVPYWADWPFETLLLPRRPVSHLPELNSTERKNLAAILQELLIRYDNLFETSFPYTMGWHGAPAPYEAHPHWQLHAHFYPPLLRSANVKKFMVGFEMLGEIQRDLTPEKAAARLRQLPSQHFRTN